MSYKKTVWVPNTTTVSSSNMNKIETQLELLTADSASLASELNNKAAASEVRTLSSEIQTLSSKTQTLTSEVQSAASKADSLSPMIDVLKEQFINVLSPLGGLIAAKGNEVDDDSKAIKFYLNYVEC